MCEGNDMVLLNEVTWLSEVIHPILTTMVPDSHSSVFFFLKREEERETETSIGLPPVHAPTRDLSRNLGMCPDWELNPLPQGMMLQPTEPHWPGPSPVLFDFTTLPAILTHLGNSEVRVSPEFHLTFPRL
uniref:Uncharacterized protein n=1 Tax=Molossus molossus TaxID=27622 RepID=A0A7J8DQB5_MOLMO|nr:hypothetical protein HJG59_009244 [Molossus molossus]